MSKSPLTDEFFLGKIVTPSAHEVADFARELECKLNEATAKLATVTKERDEARTDWNGLRDAVMGRDNHPCVNRSEAERVANVHREERDSAIARAEKAEVESNLAHDLLESASNSQSKLIIAKQELAAQVAELQRDRVRLTDALDKIGFFLAGTENDHISQKILAVFDGKTLSEACIDTARPVAGKEEGK